MTTATDLAGALLHPHTVSTAAEPSVQVSEGIVHARRIPGPTVGGLVRVPRTIRLGWDGAGEIGRARMIRRHYRQTQDGRHFDVELPRLGVVRVTYARPPRTSFRNGFGTIEVELVETLSP